MDALATPQNDLVHDPSTNNPPVRMYDVLVDEAIDKEVATADEWVTMVPRIETIDQANCAKDAIDRLNDLWDKYEAERKAEKKPHDEAAKAVQKRWMPRLHKIDLSRVVLIGLRNGWLDREDERLARERAAAESQAVARAQIAAKLAREAEEAKNPVSAKIAAEAAAERAQTAAAVFAAIPDRARVKGSYDRPAASLRTTWYAEITDVIKAARYFRDRPVLKDVLTNLASALARSGMRNPPDGPGIPGCNIMSRKE
jgi:hypothetical protein